MATESTNIKQLPSFSTIKEFEQMVIMLRTEGKQYAEITNTINAEYGLAYKELTVRQWLMSGGRLEQAYLEYNEALADAMVAEAKLKIKKLSSKAADTLDELMNESVASNVRGNAAKTVLAKYIPDRQVILDEAKADDLPSVIGDAGDDALDKIEAEAANGPIDVVDPPQS